MNDGMTYAPKGKPQPVVQKNEFKIAAVHLEHGHIYGMCNGLTEAGATLTWVYDADAKKVSEFQKRFPEVNVAESLEQILDDQEIKLVAAAAIPSERAALGLQVMAADKDYFTDKGPFTTLAQLEQIRTFVEQSSQKYMVYYSERLHVECAVYAGQLIHEGVIGRVVHVVGLGPHRLNAKQRPAWFFEKKKYGGILCDIGGHQIEQFLFFAGVQEAEVQYARAANYAHPEYPELEDFGEANLIADNGASNYLRVDWFTPDGLSTWGDGRTLILGTEGYIELRKYIDVARDKSSDHLYLVTSKGEHHIELSGKVGYPFFGELILDCLGRTENAMTQRHAFKAAELCLKAQQIAHQAERQLFNSNLSRVRER
jgi:predicted dehydrogenase